MYEKIENKMCGLGSLMVRGGCTLEERRDVACALYYAITRRFPNSVNRNRVFSRFFKLDELRNTIKPEDMETATCQELIALDELTSRMRSD